MTIYRTIHMWCDTPDCNEECDANPGDSVSIFRRQAEAWGWRRINGKDYCPEHVVVTVKPQCGKGELTTRHRHRSQCYLQGATATRSTT